MKAITQLIIQFTTTTPAGAHEVLDTIHEAIQRHACVPEHNEHLITKPSNILIKVEQTIHPEA